MRALLLAALLGTPLAAGAAFFTLAPESVGHGAPCGPDACFALAPGDAFVRVQGASGYAFHAADGRVLAEGSACGAGLLDVPPGAALLRVAPSPCA